VSHRLEHATAGSSPNEAVLAIIDQLVRVSSERLSGVGLAVAGFVETLTGRVAFAPNLHDIEPNINSRIADRFRVPVLVENDANAAVWAEGRLGAASGARNYIMLTVGTGVGGGVVINGEMYRGANGFAGEFGHMPISPWGNGNGERVRCSCGQFGCLEAVASGTALGRMAGQRAAGFGDSAVLRLAAGNPAAITGAMVGEAALTGDKFALDLLAELGTLLALGLAGLAHAFDPELIVVGGGVAEAGELFLAPARQELQRLFAGTVAPPPVFNAKLGNDAGAIGAALLASALKAS